MATAKQSAVVLAQNCASRLSTPVFDTLMASITEGILIFDNLSKILLFNAGCEKLFGYSSQEIIGTHFDDRVTVPGNKPDNGHQQFCGMRHEVTGRHKDRTSFHLCLSVNRGKSDGHDIFIAIMNDLTDHKLDHNVRRTAKLLQAMVDSVSDAIVTVDIHGLIKSFSVSASEMFGYRAEEVIGKPVTMLLPSPQREEPVLRLQRLRVGDNKKPRNGGRVVIGRKRDGSAFPMEIFVGEATDGDEPLLIGFIRDITGRPGTEQRLEQLQSELLRVSRLDSMSQMTLAIAHELNQPLAAIANFVNAAKIGLRDGSLTPDKMRATTQLMEKASSQSLRAAAILKGLRDFVEKREQTREPADLGQIIEESVALAFVSEASVAVKVVMHLDSALPLVLVDRVQIQQLLVNLIRNSLEAMQFSQNCELTLKTRRIAGDLAEVTVQDSGPGLAAKVEKNLFKPFTTSKDDGMGVGLTICQTIVEAHGGRIWLAHGGTDGTTFCFSLPLAPERHQ
ncbi:MAG TPA: PAS domain S-box protein [Rhodanobacter sp.]|nr:PAS domain S-box protein [Rhodanobacter sp.]